MTRVEPEPSTGDHEELRSRLSRRDLLVLSGP
jgi:hypothetical protein